MRELLREGRNARLTGFQTAVRILLLASISRMKAFGLKFAIAWLGFATLCAGTAYSQLGVNCGEHHDILRDRSGIVWFSSEQLRKMTIKHPEPETPSSLRGFRIEGYVSFKVLVDKNGGIGCVWDQAGNPVFGQAANEALQYWTFKPMVVNGKPMEFVGTVRFRVSSD